MNKYQYRGGGECLTSSFDIQIFAYQKVDNPYEINPFNKNYNSKADISSALVDLSYYARSNIPDYATVTEIPQDNLNYLNSGLITSNMRYMFYSCKALKTIPKLNIDTSQCTDMSGMFNNCQALTTIDLSNFNTSKVTDMGGMFYYCPALTTIDLSNWDTSNLTNMRNMFYGCLALTTINLSNFNTSKVTNMDYMFNNCKSLEHIEGIIDMKSCNSYRNMFIGCDKLSGVKIKNPPDDFESVTKLSSSQYEIVS